MTIEYYREELLRIKVSTKIFFIICIYFLRNHGAIVNHDQRKLKKKARKPSWKEQTLNAVSFEVLPPLYSPIKVAGRRDDLKKCDETY